MNNTLSGYNSFFRNATAVSNINSNPNNSFNIERGVRQDCLLASYFSLLVGEVLTHMVKNAVTYDEN